MVAVTRSKTKRDVSGGPSMVGATATTNQVKDVARAQFLIPQALYDAIRKADDIRDTIRRDNNDDDCDLKAKLDATEKVINMLAKGFMQIHELPRGWKYDHNIPIDIYVPKPLPPPKKKKVKRTITRLPTINGTALTQDEHKLWKKFTRMNIKAEAHSGYSFFGKYLVQVEETDPVVKFIVDFAVDAFNDSYHKYVKQHGRSKNITRPVPRVCEYYKLTSRYCFYVTLAATEQGKRRLYKAAVDCDRSSGARTLCEFTLTNYEPDSKRSFDEVSFALENNMKPFDQEESEYEKGWSSDESEPVDFYNISGMAPRTATWGGGFNYQNPSSILHKRIDGRKPMYCT